MKKLLFILSACIFIHGNVLAQQLFKTQDFSDKYYAKVYLESPDEVFSAGWVAIYDKATHKELVKVESEELAAGFTESGDVSTNILEVPYGEQSVIIYNDFNFDGIPDIAIQDGQNSCYHGPSFVVYLDNGTDLVYSEAFTELAQNYCGMFSIDYEKKQLYTMTKSGCCWHQYSTYILEDNKPKAIQIVEIDSKEKYSIATINIWNGNEMVETTERFLDITMEHNDVLYSFSIAKNNKRVVFFTDLNGENLTYAFLNKEQKIEMLYPDDFYSDETIGDGDGNFDLKSDKDQTTLTFKTKDAIYTIYSSPKEIGINVSVNGKTYKMIGAKNSQIGSLEDIANMSLKNVTYIR